MTGCGRDDLAPTKIALHIDDVCFGELVVQALLAFIDGDEQVAKSQGEAAEEITQITDNSYPQVDRLAAGFYYLNVEYHLPQRLSLPCPHADEIDDVGSAPADETEEDDIYEEGQKPFRESGVGLRRVDNCFCIRAHLAHLELLFQDADDS